MSASLTTLMSIFYVLSLILYKVGTVDWPVTMFHFELASVFFLAHSGSHIILLLTVQYFEEFVLCFMNAFCFFRPALSVFFVFSYTSPMGTAPSQIQVIVKLGPGSRHINFL